MDDRPILTSASAAATNIMFPPPGGAMESHVNYNNDNQHRIQHSLGPQSMVPLLACQENGLDSNENNSRSSSGSTFGKSSNNKLSGLQRPGGQRFETFVMTGDMIIRTTSPKKNKQDAVKPDKTTSPTNGQTKDVNNEEVTANHDQKQKNNKAKSSKDSSKKSKPHSRIPKPLARSPEKKPISPTNQQEENVTPPNYECFDNHICDESLEADSAIVCDDIIYDEGHMTGDSQVVLHIDEPEYDMHAPPAGSEEYHQDGSTLSVVAEPPVEVMLEVTAQPALDLASPEYIELQNAELILGSFTDYSESEAPFPPPPEEAYAPAVDLGEYPDESDAPTVQSSELEQCETCSHHLSARELKVNNDCQLDVNVSQEPQHEQQQQQQHQQQQRRSIVISKSAEKIMHSPKKCVSSNCNNQGSSVIGVRTSKSHENYLESEGLDSLALVSIDFEDNIASSVDALHYDKSVTSLDCVMVGSSGGDDADSRVDLSSRSLDNSVSPSQRQHHTDKPLMPTFISLEEPRSITKLKEGGKVREFQSDGRPVYEQSVDDRPSTHNKDLTITAAYSGIDSANNDDAVSESSDQSSAEFYDNTSNTEYISIEDQDEASDQMTTSITSQHHLENGSESDSDSIYHQPLKGVDRPSANRLAKRLYNLDGFKKTDITRHLCKKNDFSYLVGEEYLQFFDFTGDSLDVALRKFLKQITLTGETQERERVLIHFSHRYLECNPGTYNSDDAAHTLTCAMMLLNTDLHGQNIGRKMTLSEFIENLADLNEGENFPKEELKILYQGIKSEPLECEFEEDYEGYDPLRDAGVPSQQDASGFIGYNPFLEIPDPNKTVEYKKGYVMRKCCFDPDGRRTPFGKRGWKMFFVTLKDMILYLHKDEHGFKKNSLCDNLSNAIRIHHAMATKATDYKKKQHVLRLQTADWAQYLFQTSDSKELQSWIDTINLVASSLSAPPLPSGCGSQRRFQRPLLPSGYTKLNMRDQLMHHESKVTQTEQELQDHRQNPPDKGAKSRVITEYIEKETYLQFELQRFKTYAYLLQSKLTAEMYEPSLVETAIGEVDEPTSQTEESSKPSPASVKRTIKPVQRSLSDRPHPDFMTPKRAEDQAYELWKRPGPPTFLYNSSV